MHALPRCHASRIAPLMSYEIALLFINCSTIARTCNPCLHAQSSLTSSFTYLQGLSLPSSVVAIYVGMAWVEALFGATWLSSCMYVPGVSLVLRSMLSQPAAFWHVGSPIQLSLPIARLISSRQTDMIVAGWPTQPQQPGCSSSAMQQSSDQTAGVHTCISTEAL